MGFQTSRATHLAVPVPRKPAPVRAVQRALSPLAALLVAQGAVPIVDARRADQIAEMHNCDLWAVFHAECGLSHLMLAQAEAALHDTVTIDPLKEEADPTLIAAFGPQAALQRRILPWRRAGGATIVLSAKPQDFARHLPALRATFGPVRMAVTTQDQLDQAIGALSSAKLVADAEVRLPAADSSRGWNSQLAMVVGVSVLSFLALALAIAPQTTFTAICTWVVVIMAMTSALKLAAADRWMARAAPTR